MAGNLLVPLVSTALKVGSKLKNIASKKITTGQAVTAVTAGAAGGKGVVIIRYKFQ